MAVLVRTSDIAWETWQGVDRGGSAGLHWKLLLSSERTSSRAMTMGLAEIKAGDVLALHHHEPAEIYFVLNGEGVCEIEGDAHDMRPGSALFIPGGALHRTSNTGRGPLRFLFVFPEDSMDAVEYHFPEQGTQEALPAVRPVESNPALTNPDSTPGTSMLAEVGGDDTNMQPSG